MRFIYAILIVTGIGAIEAGRIKREDIIIVHLTGSDIGKTFSSEEGAFKERALFGPKMAEFIEYAGKHARFLIIDNFFSKYEKSDHDDLIVSALKSTKRVTLPAIQYVSPQNLKLRTPREFLTSVPYAGHGAGARANPPTGEKTELTYYYVPGYFCDGTSAEFIPVEKCEKTNLRKHTAMLAVEGFLNVSLHPSIDIAYWLPLETFESFKTYTVKEFEANKGIIHNKLVIFQKLPLATTNTFKKADGKFISGSEILANLIMLFSDEFAPP